MRRLHRRSRRRGESGVGMVELMATIALMSVVMVAVYQGIDSLTTAASGTDARLVNLNEARILMGAASKDLRTAGKLQAGTPAFTVAKDREVTFYANMLPNPTVVAPRQIHIYVDAQNQLIEEVKAPDAGSVAPNYTYTDPANQPTVRFVGRYIANGGTNPIFTYNDWNRQAITPTPLSSQNLLAIRSVTIQLMIRKSAYRNTGYTTLLNTVRLPNLDYSAVIG
jgi:hypothetical protein